MNLPPDLQREVVEALRVMFDQIDGDPRAVQFFDHRLITRTRELLARIDAAGKVERIG